MAYYIDIDWNIARIYHNQELILIEPAIILHDLLTEKVMFVGEEAKLNLSNHNNLLAVVFIENRKLLHPNDLILFLRTVIKKYQLNQKECYFVNRNQILDENQINFQLVSETKFLAMLGKEKSFLDLRNNEIIFYNQDTKNITVFPQGKNVIQNLINRYFYLNFNVTLNTKKTIELMEKLAQGPVNQVLCRSLTTGKDEWIAIKSKTELLKEVKALKTKIWELIPQNTPSLEQTSEFRKVFNLIDN